MDKETKQKHSFGKFDSAEELLAAYNALQSEFTKRCQLVKQLQARLDSDAQTDPPETSENVDIRHIEKNSAPADPTAAESPAPVETAAQQVSGVQSPQHVEQGTPAQPVEPEIAAQPVQEKSEIAVAVLPPTPDAVIAEIAANADDYAAALSEIPQVMNECVARYKQMLLCADTGIHAVRGAAVLTPVNRPRTLVDAKRIADRMLKS